MLRAEGSGPVISIPLSFLGTMPSTMQLDPDNQTGLSIRSFTAGAIHIQDEVWTRPVILTPEKIIGEWAPPPIAEMRIEDFKLILDQEPEVIVFGTGIDQRFPNGTLTTAILRQGIGFEVMATAAACRTFNVLVSEYRRVVAALLVS
jgi:uncharacterized protein